MTEEFSRFLPQHGFGPDVNFDTIVRYHPFLFRVYTPRTRSPHNDDSIFFIGAQFDAKFAPKTPVMSGIHGPAGSLLDAATYEDCVRHLDWETRSTSPFISTSFSFAWSLWDAVRRYNTGMKHDVEIAIIDASALSGRAVTAIQLLRKKPLQKQHAHHWRWYRFAQESQSVLVHGFIPRSAVIASIPLLPIIQSLPSYFLKPRPSRSIGDNNSLSALVWDFNDSKNRTYRKFCLDLQSRFLRLPFNTRMRDLTVGSVRLAMTLLHPWFHEMIMEDDDARFNFAVAKTRELAGIIAHWPEQSGSRDYSEMQGVIKGLILLLAEEVRSLNHQTTHSRTVTDSEVEKLQRTVVNLEGVREQARIIVKSEIRPVTADLPVPASTQDRDVKLSIIECRTTFDSLEKVILSSPSSSISPRNRKAPLRLSIPHSPTCSSSSASSPVSPVTPSPEVSYHSPSPIRLNLSKARFLEDQHDAADSSSTSSSHRSSGDFPHSISAPPTPTTRLSPSPSISDDHSHSAPPSPTSLRFSQADDIAPPIRSGLPSHTQVDSDQLVTQSPLRISIPIHDDAEYGPVTSSSRYFTALSPRAKSTIEGTTISPLSPFYIIGMEYFPSTALTSAEADDGDNSREQGTLSSWTMQDTISCAVTGFLVGAFITLCVLSSQRRALINHLT